MITEEAKKKVFCSEEVRTVGRWLLDGVGDLLSSFFYYEDTAAPLPGTAKGGGDANVYIKSTPSSLPLPLGAAMRWVGERATTRGGEGGREGATPLRMATWRKGKKTNPHERTNERSRDSCEGRREGGSNKAKRGIRQTL